MRERLRGGFSVDEATRRYRDVDPLTGEKMSPSPTAGHIRNYIEEQRGAFDIMQDPKVMAAIEEVRQWGMILRQDDVKPEDPRLKDEDLVFIRLERAYAPDKTSIKAKGDYSSEDNAQLLAKAISQARELAVMAEEEQLPPCVFFVDQEGNVAIKKVDSKVWRQFLEEEIRFRKKKRNAYTARTSRKSTIVVRSELVQDNRRNGRSHYDRKDNYIRVSPSKLSQFSRQY